MGHQAMELGESNLQLVFIFRLERFNPQKVIELGVSLGRFTSKQHRGYSRSNVWGHIYKAYMKIMI